MGAHHQPRHSVRVPVARPEHRRRLRRAARPGIHRLLCGGRLCVRPARLAAFQSAPAVLGHPAHRRARRLPVRCAAGRAHAQITRRLPRHRHARLRRDRAHFPQQPVAAGQYHQRPAGHLAHRPVQFRRLQLQPDADPVRPRVFRSDQVLLPAAAAVAAGHSDQPAAAALAHRPRLGGGTRGRDRGTGDGHQYDRHQAARFRHGRLLRRRRRRHVRRHPGLHQPGELRPGRIRHGAVDGGAGRHGQCLGGGAGRRAAIFRARTAALHGRAGAEIAVRENDHRARGDTHAAVWPGAGTDDALPAGGPAAVGGKKARTGPKPKRGCDHRDCPDDGKEPRRSEARREYCSNAPAWTSALAACWRWPRSDSASIAARSTG